MLKEPKIFCPKCGKRATIIEWYEFDPGRALGYGNCPRHGALDFRIGNNKVT